MTNSDMIFQHHAHIDQKQYLHIFLNRFWVIYIYIWPAITAALKLFFM